MLEQASSAVVNKSIVRVWVIRPAFQGNAEQEKNCCPKQSQVQTIRTCSCHFLPLSFQISLEDPRAIFIDSPWKPARQPSIFCFSVDLERFIRNGLTIEANICPEIKDPDNQQ